MIGARQGPGAAQSAFAVLIPSPGLALMLAAVPGAPVQLASLLWASLGTTMGLTVVCLVASSLIVPRVWHDQPVSSRRMAWRERRTQWAYGARAAREALRHRLLAVNPFFWLTSRDRLKPWYVWSVFAGAALFWLWGRREFGADWEDAGALLSLSQFLYGAVKLWIAACVVTRLAEDRRSAALELLLTTPVRVRDIRLGLYYSIRRQFLWPLLLLIGLDLFLAWVAARQYYGEREMMVGVYASRLVLLVLDVVTLWALGPWVAVKARHPNQAAAQLLLRVCVLPWLVFIVLTIAAGIAAEWRLVQWNWSERMVLAGWFLLGLLNDLGWLVYALTRPESAWRAAAAARYERSSAWWQWWRPSA
jgi:hypothetical protein